VVKEEKGCVVQQKEKAAEAVYYLKASVLARSTWGKQVENVLKRPGMAKG
jgi:hypothetical protein